MSLDNLTPVTALWLAIALTALFFAILNWQSSRHDVKASSLVTNYRRPTRMLLARGAVHRNKIKVGVFAWWSILGVAFGLFDLPDVPRLGGTLGLIVTAGALAYIGYHEGRERALAAALLNVDIAIDVRAGHEEDVAEAKRTSRLHEEETDATDEVDK